MLSSLKEKMMSKGMSLLQSPAVTKLLESEKVGLLLEKGMTFPFKVSSALMAQKERFVALLDLATQEDMDEVKRAVGRLENALKDIRKDSGDLLKKMGETNTKPPSFTN